MEAVELNAEQFGRLMAGGETVLVDYWAPWCSYCRRIAPAYEAIAGKFGGQLVVAKVNIDDEPMLAHREQIEVIPTLVLYRDGKVIARAAAPESRDGIEAFLRRALTAGGDGHGPKL